MSCLPNYSESPDQIFIKHDTLSNVLNADMLVRPMDGGELRKHPEALQLPGAFTKEKEDENTYVRPRNLVAHHHQ